MSNIVKELLQNPKVRIKNPAYVEKTLAEIIAGGAQKLQVISDFDQTLTKDHDEEGKRCLTTFGIFHSIPELPDGYTAKSHDLYNQFHPYEIHPNMTVEEKTPYMEQWYRKSEALLAGSNVSEKNLENQVNKCDTQFRDGAEAMFEEMKKADIPVLVFSAGVGDVVRVALEKHKMLQSNVRIISNFLNWEKDSGKLTGFKGDMIHVFNKNQRALAAHEEYFSLLAHRPNVVLLGDNEGDAAMGHGVQDPAAMIKIGFLYLNAESRLEMFMNQFDIVLIDDQSMSIPTKLVNSIIGPTNVD